MYNLDINKIDNECMCVRFTSLPQNKLVMYPRRISPDTTCVQNEFRRCNQCPKKANSILGQNLLLRNSQFTCLQFPTSRNVNIPVGPIAIYKQSGHSNF